MKGLNDKNIKILKREAKGERGGREGNGEKPITQLKAMTKQKQRRNIEDIK